MDRRMEGQMSDCIRRERYGKRACLADSYNLN